ncbi:MAG: DNA gyrase subunit A [Bacteroidia bacterium]
MAEGEKIIPINIEEEMRSAYIDYSMSVIVSRALPDVRDGLKPVHRRVLYAMTELGLGFNRPYKKSARIVGEVLGKYHPHGDSAVYDTMVRMAQEWSMRYRLVDGQGNFGSVDGDPPAAMRYTEARLSRIAEELLTDLDKNTVDFRPNFDESLKEPVVLPAGFPNLLANGGSGIAVGMATNMAPHNLSEVLDGTIAYIDNNDITIEELMQFIKAPDFPTGGIIYGYDGVKRAFETGRGRVMMRGKTNIEPSEKGSDKIIVTELPFQVNKANMIKATAELVKSGVIEGISAVNDESDRSGYRVVYEVRRDAVSNVVLNQLFKYTQLQSSFSINNVALVKGRPIVLNLKDMVKYYVEHRHEVIVRRTQYELDEAEKRAHILQGLIIAIDNLDEVINLIRGSRTPDEAREGLMSRFELSEIQAKAILDLRLQKLTGLERDKLKDEYNELMKTIEYLKSVLENKELRMQIIKDELTETKKKFGDERRTEVLFTNEDISIEDLIPNEEMVVTISHMGYMKRTPLADYKSQGRGGRGSKGAGFRQEDFTEYLFVAFTHNYMLFFTEKGRCFWMKVWEIPEGTRTTKGRAVQNLLYIEPDDKIRAVIPVNNLENEEYLNNNFILFCTEKGIIKKTPLEAYSRPRIKGINAITIDEDDQLLEVALTSGNSEVMIASTSGQAIRFHESAIRPMGRTARGVIGIRLSGKKDDKVIGMVSVADEESTVMVVSEKGYGKRSQVGDYRITNRGAKGVKTLQITDKTGKLIAIKNVTDQDDLMIINKSGITIRIAMDKLRTIGRATQGVRLIRLGAKDEIASVAKVAREEEEELAAEGEIEGEVIELSNEEISPDEPENENPDETGSEDEESNN